MPTTRSRATAGAGGRVVVLASFMMDLVAHAPRRPRSGESLFGSDFGMFVGGKGNNQAIAAARADAAVRVVGRLGDDIFAPRFFETLDVEGIAREWVRQDAEAGTGVAMPLIEPDGQNSIVAVPRANQRVTPEQVREAAAAFEDADVLLAQFEVPIPAVVAALDLARAHGVYTIVNPAPVPDPLPTGDDWLRLVDLLVPNEHEVAGLTGIAVTSPEDAERAARALLARGCGSVAVTLGSRGALWLRDADAQALHLPPFDVRQVDATAAGDAFCGALAAALSRGLAMEDALRRATAAGALAVTRHGAAPSMPTTVEIDALLAQERR